MPTLSPQERLGPYRVEALIGSGGMGEVYRAEDTRLGRAVAVKVLPAGLAQDRERLLRFEQEARAAAALNHPAILAVHDVGSHGELPFIVTELLQGQTLRERLQGGRLSPRRTIELASQVSDGLAAAHEKGIVHRDLKPENLFVTRQERVKILDFGLAKLTQPERAADDLSSLATAAGLIVGTVGYMSPEQVRGEKADHRADIFSFGAILYEMLSGRRAFRGATAIETLTAILNQDPPPLAEAVAELPAALELVVRRCLEKEPANRFQSARDLTFALSSLASTSIVAASRPGPDGRRPLRRPLLAMAAAVVVAGAFLAGAIIRSGPHEPVSYQRLTYRRGTIRTARFAPDGHTVLYGAAWDGAPFALYSTHVASPESTAILHPQADLLAVSPLGNVAASLRATYSVGFIASGTLASLPLTGGAARELLEQVLEADFKPGGEELAIVRRTGNMTRLESPPGTVLRETSGWISNPRVSPDGTRIAFVEHPDPGHDGGRVMVLELADGSARALTPDCASVLGLAWSSQRSEVWFAASLAGEARALHAVTMSGRLRTVVRAPGVVTLHDLDAEGTALMTIETARRGIRGVFPPGGDERELSWLDWSMPLALSADGRTLLFEEQFQGAGSSINDVYVRSTDGSPALRLGEGLVGFTLSPDGQQVMASDLDRGSLISLPVGAGERRTLDLEGLESVLYAALTADGRVLLLAREPGLGFQVFVQDTDGRHRAAVTPKGIAVPIGVAPGCARVVVGTAEGTTCIFALDGVEVECLPEIEPDLRGVAWSADGRSILFERMGSLPHELLRFDLERRTLEPWKRLMPADPAGVSAIAGVRVTPDFSYYAYSYRRVLSELFVARGLR